MESLSQVLKGMNNLTFVQKAEEKKQQLLADSLIVKLRAKYPELTDEVLKLHLNRLYQYVTEYRHCSNCPGLDRCPNDFTGHYTKLSVETVNGMTQIYDQKISCKKMLAKHNQDAVRRRIRSFYVDERALNQAYVADEILFLDPARAKSVERVMKYIVRTKENGLQTNGLYLSGPFGTGKTFLMCYLLHELAKVGLSGVIVYMPDFVEDLKAMFHEPHKLKETVEIMKETDLLIFDDIGAENLNPWLRDHVMGSILNYRMNRRPTFYTSNYHLDDLEKHLSFTNKDGDEEYKGRRIMDRIRPFVETIDVHGENKRGVKRSG
jgi:primosomal protein DnaI